MNNEKGISLLEALVGMLVLVIGLLGMAPLFVLSVESNGVSSDMMVVSNLAKEKLELYSNVDSIPINLPYKQIENSVRSHYHRITYIYDNTTDPTLSEDLCNINVTIAWIDNTDVTRTMQFTSTIMR